MSSKKMHYGWWIVIALTLNLAVVGPAAVSVANIFQKPVTEAFQISNSSFAINNLIVLGSGIFYSPPVARFLTEKHYKFVLISGAIAYGLGLIGYGLSNNIFLFYLFSLAIGYGYIATAIMPTTVIVNNWFVKKRGLALSIALSGLGVGAFIMSPLLTFLIDGVGWRMTYLIYGIGIIVLSVPLSLFVIVFTPRMKNLKPFGSDQVTNETRGRQEFVEQKSVNISVRDSLNKPFFIFLMIGSAIIGLTANGGLGQFPPAFTELHGAVIASGLVSIYSISGIVGKLLLGYVSDQFGVKTAAIYTSLTLVITYGLMYFSANPTIAVLASVTFGIGNSNVSVLVPLFTSVIFSSLNYSQAYGIVQSAKQFGMAVGSLFVAMIADLSGSYQLSWLIMALLSVSIIFFYLGSMKLAEKYM